MEKIIIPKNYNYIGIFLTFACQLKCPYCINYERGFKPKYKTIPGADWIKVLNRIETRPDLPITLQGGEPSLYSDFYQIIKLIRKDINIDMLTNCQFDIDEFCRNIHPERMKRKSLYASIRVSYHPLTMSLNDTIERVRTLLNRGYSVGVWIVNNPTDPSIGYSRQRFLSAGIDCRLKEYLDGKDYGTYRYMDLQSKKNMLCRPSEFLIAPDGGVFRCHGDLYGNREPYSSIFDAVIRPIQDFAPCKKVACASCDIKVKNSRFQVWGHTSVEIK